jgi:hypothetical protein
MIPFTSPIVMMVRLPFDVPAWEIALSIAFLVLSFIGTTWVAGKIYRTGILMYGKKITWGECGNGLNTKATNCGCVMVFFERNYANFHKYNNFNVFYCVE